MSYSTHTRMGAATLALLGVAFLLPDEAGAQRSRAGVTASVPTPPPGNGASVTVTKSVTDLNGGLVVAGDVLQYEISIANGGPANAEDVELADAIPAHVTYVPGSLRVLSGPGAGPKTDAAGDDQGTLVPTPQAVRFLLGEGATAVYGGSLPAGSATSVRFQVIVNTGVAGGTIISNQAFVSYLDFGTGQQGTTPSTPPGGPPEGAPTVVTVAVPGTPDLEMRKVSGALTLGAVGTFSLTVTNVGTAATTGTITVTDNLPDGLTFVSAAGAGFTCASAGALVTCSRTVPLAVNESAAITLLVRVGINALGGVTNSATVSTSGDTNPANDTSTIGPVPVSTSPDLSLSKTAPATFVVGQPLHYVLKVSNGANGATTEPIVITDILPAGVTLIGTTGAGWTCTLAGQTLSCTHDGPLQPGTSLTLNVSVMPSAEAGSMISNTARVGTTGDPNAANDQDTAVSTLQGRIDLSLSKAGPDELTPGEEAIYTLEIRNGGMSATTDEIIVTDTLPVGLTFMIGTGNGFTCTANGQVVRCTRSAPALGPGEVVTVSITVSVADDATASLANVACVETAGDEQTSNDCGTKSSAVTGVVDLELIKDVAPEADAPGFITFVLSVRNVGTLTALPPLTLTDTLRPGLTFVSGAGAGWQCSAVQQVVSCTGNAALARGMTTVVRLKASVSPSAGSQISNCADVSGANENGSLANNRSCIDRRIIGAGVLEASKRASKGEAEIGDQVDYEVLVRNTGDAPAADVELVDVLPQGFLLDVRTIRVNGAPVADVAGAPGPRITIRLGTLAAGGSATVRYRVRIAPGARLGDNRNVAVAGSGEITSPPAEATVRVKGGVFEERGAIAGRVHLVCDCAEGGAALGIPGVRVYLEDGTSVITDEEGKYTFPSVSSRLHVVRVDRSSLPEGAVLVPLGSRNAGDGYSRFVDLRAGELHRADFADSSRAADVLQRVLERRLAEESDGDVEGVAPNEGVLVSGLVSARIDLAQVIRGGLGVSAAGSAFEETLRDWSYSSDDGKVTGGARAALLVKGRVMDDATLTVAYDSERDRGRTFFRDISPDQSYNVFGDASIRDFETQSRRRFYARLDKGDNYTMFGDFRTGRSDQRRMLSSYDRSLTGALQHLRNDRGSVTMFVSQGHLRQVVDELPGRGISGPYALTRATGLVNSERVEIVVRDRNQPAVILSRRALARFADYTVETGTGRLIFRAPVPSVDANLNPVSVRVTYEAEDGASDAFWVYGVDASLKVSSRLEVGGTFANDDNGVEGNQLLGVNATARLGASTTLMGEFARASHTAGADGSAHRIELAHRTGPLEAAIFAIRSERDFLNTSSAFSGGRTEAGTRFTARLTDGTRLLGEAIRTESEFLDGRRDGALLSIERRLSAAWSAEVGYRYAREAGVSAPIGGLAPPLDRDVSAIRGRLSLTLPERSRTSLFGEFEQDVRSSEQQRAAVGGEYALTSRTRLYARHEWLSAVDGPYAINQMRDQAYTVFGVDGDYFQDTEVFSEYRARDAFTGRDIEAAIGLRNRWGPAPGLTVNTSFERVSPLVVSSGGQSAIAGEALAVTGAMEWTRAETWKSTARVEMRNADTGDNRLLSLGFARKLNRDFTFLARTLWDDFASTRQETRGFSQAGLAWRQANTNRWNALARYEHRYEGLGALAGTSATRDEAHIGAAIVNYQPVTRLTLSGRYATKYATHRLEGTQSASTAQLFMGRGVLDITNRFDVGLITSALAGGGEADRLYGLGGELGVVVMKNVRIAGGYNLFGFTDRDFSSFGTTRRGAYVEFGFKFDEGLFGAGGSPRQVP